jgi:muramoyltetrapeptide carboxypeptidase
MEGLKPILSQSALKAVSPHQAGSLTERVQDIHEMFLNKEIKGIFCTTGRYISIQLLEFIDWNIIWKNPKMFIGYSDITILLNSIYAKTGLPTFHGSMVEWLDRGDTRMGRFTIRNFKNITMKGLTGKLIPCQVFGGILFDITIFTLYNYCDIIRIW